MKLSIRLKSIGKKRPIFTLRQIDIQKVATLRQIITEIVTEEVALHNDKPIDEALFYFEEEDHLNDAIERGKVSFGAKKTARQQHTTVAVEQAIQAFEDGLFIVLIEDVEIKNIDEPLEIRENDMLTFIKLTMLAGRLW